MLNIYNTADEALTALAEYFVIIGSEAITKNGKFSVALSGGSSPKKLYELLADS
jgi:6-phosphogluconolactonase